MAWESCHELGRARIPLAGDSQTVSGAAVERNRETGEVRFRPHGRAVPTQPGPDEPNAEPESYVIPESQFEPL